MAQNTPKVLYDCARAKCYKFNFNEADGTIQLIFHKFTSLQLKPAEDMFKCSPDAQGSTKMDEKFTVDLNVGGVVKLTFKG